MVASHHLAKYRNVGLHVLTTTATSQPIPPAVLCFCLCSSIHVSRPRGEERRQRTRQAQPNQSSYLLVSYLAARKNLD